MLKACYFIMEIYFHVSCMWLFLYHLRLSLSSCTRLAISNRVPRVCVSKLVIRLNVLFIFINQ